MATITLCTTNSNPSIPRQETVGLKVWNPRDHIPETVQRHLKRPQPNYQLAFLHIIQELKVQRRTGWLDYDISECESISDHMYRMGVTCMLIQNPDVQKDKCVKIALVHDMAESLVGDITPLDPMGKKEKHRREWEAMKYICDDILAKVNPVAAREIKEDWLNYENIETLEARYVKDIDKYELLVQCFEYEQKFNGLKNFQSFFKVIDSIKTEEVRGWALALVELRDEFFASL
ncbi:5'-deoxynucleotidase KNAG_0M00590 [Huiozyma naganishii CBS 8797]|uniref:5'-deoxynucleotidase n=1 Tax=Huiozyma naganishii (strain ATCC MYA-139 / BCRC 22969 / CBS 8797 / KCTC 17520 / NBRC 10181 / NCYC 3082 / Yp74L-3) TaxID=1071383 RepID=J7S3Z0_HUIN7|nr:hypothetical protein KNAG_0M00590 [Kazachstania naganishii CBS 8797]CCK72912.1 hypothetical protein KNAG_0M00590 [Kazachstania naganishii CBS 8797]